MVSFPSDYGDSGSWDSSTKEWTEGSEGENGGVIPVIPLVINKAKGPPRGTAACDISTRLHSDQAAECGRLYWQKPGGRLGQWLLRVWDQGGCYLIIKCRV